MEGNKLDIVAKEKELSPSATYKQIPDEDMEDQPLSRPKSLISNSKNNEPDGADEKMLPEDEKKISNSLSNVAEIKFTNNDKQNGDAKLDIGEVKTEFVGMSKEELMKYANDPFWVRLRWFLFIGFWLLWAGMLVGAIMIIVAAPKCAPPEPKTWWEEGPLVEVYDVNADLFDNLVENGVAGVIVPYPVDTYKPMNSTEAFTSFLKLVHDKNLKFIVELVPGSSSVWFNKSEQKDDEYNDYYIWAGHEGIQKDAKPPNNWLSKESTDMNKISAWKYSENRKQFYLAPTSVPQLNFRQPKVVEAFSNTLQTFIDAGVDGVRLKGAPNLFVNPNFEDEIPSNRIGDYSQGHYNFYSHFKTENLQEIGPLLKQWRDIFKNKTKNGVFMLAENLNSLDSYKSNGTLVVDLPKHSYIFEENNLTAEKLKAGLDKVSHVLESNWPLWQVKANDLPADVLNVVCYLLKGTTIIPNDMKIDQELKDTRKSPSIMFGTENRYIVANYSVFAYARVHSGNPGYLVAINPTDQRVVVDFPNEVPFVSSEVTVQYLSKSYNETNVDLRMKSNANVFPMSPKSAVVLSYVPKD